MYFMYKCMKKIYMYIICRGRKKKIETFRIKIVMIRSISMMERKRLIHSRVRGWFLIIFIVIWNNGLTSLLPTNSFPHNVIRTNWRLWTVVVASMAIVDEWWARCWCWSEHEQSTRQPWRARRRRCRRIDSHSDHGDIFYF